MTRDEVALLLVAIAAMAFVAWELAALIPSTPIHTISWLSQHNSILRYAVLLAFLLLIPWWIWHTAPGSPLQK